MGRNSDRKRHGVGRRRLPTKTQVRLRGSQNTTSCNPIRKKLLSL